MRILAFLLLLIISSLASTDEIFVRSKWLVDVDTGEIFADPVIVIQKDKIVKVGDITSIKVPEGASIIDLKDSYLLPGLMDAHVHLAWSQPGQTGLAGVEEARTTLFAGFTTVRNPGSTGNADILLRDSIEKGTMIGPRMFVAGPALGAKDGVCDQVFAGEGVIHSPEEAMRRVAELAKLKVDLIKFCAGGQVLPSDQDISAKELEDSIVQAIVFEARKHNLKVAAHAQGPDAIIQSVTAGVHSIEHGGMINEEAALLMKKNKTYLVPTLYRLDWVLENAKKNGAAKDRLDLLETARSKARDRVSKAIALGTPIAFGTDATVYPHGLNAREFSVLVELGLSPLQALQSATIHATDLVGWSGKIGRIRPGYFADIIAVSANPLKDIKSLENVTFVMKSGVVYKEFKK